MINQILDLLINYPKRNEERSWHGRTRTYGVDPVIEECYTLSSRPFVFAKLCLPLDGASSVHEVWRERVPSLIRVVVVVNWLVMVYVRAGVM
jgi:hypothetical protein